MLKNAPVYLHWCETVYSKIKLITRTLPNLPLGNFEAPELESKYEWILQRTTEGLRVELPKMATSLCDLELNSTAEPSGNFIIYSLKDTSD